MDILLYIIIVILVSFIIYLKINTKKYESNFLIKEQELKKHLHNLEVQGLEAINKELTKRKEDAYREFSLVKEQLIREQESLKNYKEQQIITIEQETQLYRQEQINNIQRELLLLDLAEQEKYKQQFEKYKTNYNIEIERANNELKILLDDLNDLRQKRENTLNIIKEEEKLKNEIDFYRIVLTEEDIEDISQLKTIEKKLHNKDVLHKLIYKTYIEIPMNSMFARIGIKESPGIYKITNINNKMCYIGQSTNVKNRVKAHVQSSIGISNIAAQLVHEKMKEEGLENFSFQLLEECEKDQLNIREKYWINYYDSNHYGYNGTGGGSKKSD